MAEYSDVNIYLKLREGTLSRLDIRQALTVLFDYVEKCSDPTIENLQCALKKPRPYLTLRITGVTVKIMMDSADNVEDSNMMRSIVGHCPVLIRIVHITVNALAVRRIEIPTYVISGLAVFFLQVRSLPRPLRPREPDHSCCSQLLPHIPRNGPITIETLRSFFSFICHFNFGSRLVVVNGSEQVLFRTDGTRQPAYIALRDEGKSVAVRLLAPVLTEGHQRCAEYSELCQPKDLVGVRRLRERGVRRVQE